MFEFGTEVFFAFWMASTRVGFPARSAPPSLAATSMFLMSLANDLARRESLIAFWCLVVAHLEWPDMLNILASAAGAADEPCRRVGIPARLPGPSPARGGSFDLAAGAIPFRGE